MKTHYIPLFLIFLLLGGCLEKEKESFKLSLEVKFPEELAEISKTGVSIKLFNINSGITYVRETDENGIARFDVEYGFYEAIAQGQYVIQGVNWVVNGRIEYMALTPSGNATHNITDHYSMDLVMAKTGGLIIKEIYYSGCKADNGDNYNTDGYVALYNNSSSVLYLDNLCLGYVNPMTSSSPSTFVKPDGSLMDSLPVASAAWKFPGTGTTYPVNPGEEVIIAVNAVNHAARQKNSIDLSTADFAFYATDLINQEVPVPTVPKMDMIWRHAINAYTLVLTGPAMVLFYIEGDLDDYVGNPKNILRNPAQPNSSMRYLGIPSEWVIDGVECVISATQANKRLTTNIDAGFIYVPTRNTGVAVIRKVDKVEDGITIYTDSNNSSMDFEVKTASLKK